MDLLDQLINKEITIDETIALTKTLKQQRVMQDTFVAEVGLISWDEAVAVLPQFATHIDLYKEEEHAFKVMCTLQPSISYKYQLNYGYHIVIYILQEFCNEARLCKEAQAQDTCTADETETVMMGTTTVMVRTVPAYAMDQQLGPISAQLIMLNAKVRSNIALVIEYMILLFLGAH